jgi:hypothetical protein
LNLNSLLSGALLGIVGALSDIYNAADQLFQWLEDLATLGGIL